ncbi:MAG: efflux RND transporter periplasmic adaptor subunit [Planctomycetes bacterium]|nr:efflux RND transporter periplasmic adaptor subunit [Planctomycetota bacterium]
MNKEILKRFGLAFRIIQIRLRFILIMAITGVVVAKWEAIQNHLDRWRHPVAPDLTSTGAMEYYCPMHAQVVRDAAGNCPICGMPLSSRARTPRQELPPGVLARVLLPPTRVALAGIHTSKASYQFLERAYKAPGVVERDDRRVSDITVKAKGRLEAVRPTFEGETLAENEWLADLYSPEIVNAEQEYLQLTESASNDPNAKDIGEFAKEKLIRLGMSPAEIQTIEKDKKPLQRISIRSGISGTVAMRDAVAGKYVNEGDRLYQIVNLKTVWVSANVYEFDLKQIRHGQPMEIRGPGIANSIPGIVTFIDPSVDSATRTAKVRAEVNNESGALRPGMFVTVSLQMPVEGRRPAASQTQPASRPAGAQPARGTEVLAVPASAVIDTGARTIVYIEREPGVYEARQIAVGARSGEWLPVLDGLDLNDTVVTAGAFLLDAETRLNAGAERPDSTTTAPGKK